jgi:hypothetical protein
MSCGAAVYRRLIQVCPRALRVQYGDEMVLLFEDMLGEADGRLESARVWCRAIRDLGRLALSHAVRTDRFAVVVLTWAMSAACFTAELFLARSFETPRFAFRHAVAAVVVCPSLLAALVSLVATRAARTRLSLFSEEA